MGLVAISVEDLSIVGKMNYHFVMSRKGDVPEGGLKETVLPQAQPR